MDKKKMISVLLPSFSIFIVMAALFFLKPTTTGLVIYEPNDTSKLVNADVLLKTKSNEVIPPNALVQVKIDDKKAEMLLSEFIKKTGQPYNVSSAEIPDIGFYGPGFTGEHTYNLTLADFKIDRNIGTGEHVFTTSIIYRGKVLYQKENRIMISE
jgi:hypothetical protein